MLLVQNVVDGRVYLVVSEDRVLVVRGEVVAEWSDARADWTFKPEWRKADLHELELRDRPIAVCPVPRTGPAMPLEKIARCEICDWPLAASVREGCVAGNCSARPPVGSEEHRRLQQRRFDLLTNRKAMG